jgi:hypothetical protein
MLVGFVVVDPVCLCGAGEPVGQHGGGGLPREPWIGASEPERQTFESPCPPRDGRRDGPPAEGLLQSWKWFTPGVLGLTSRRRTPYRVGVCVRIAGAGRRKAVEPVTTRGSMTT